MRQTASLLHDGRPQVRQIDGIVIVGGRDVTGERTSSSLPPVLSLLTGSPYCSPSCCRLRGKLCMMVTRAPEGCGRSVALAVCMDPSLMCSGPVSDVLVRSGVAASVKYNETWALLRSHPLSVHVSSWRLEWVSWGRIRYT